MYNIQDKDQRNCKDCAGFVDSVRLFCIFWHVFCGFNNDKGQLGVLICCFILLLRKGEENGKTNEQKIHAKNRIRGSAD